MKFGILMAGLNNSIGSVNTVFAFIATIIRKTTPEYGGTILLRWPFKCVNNFCVLLATLTVYHFSILFQCDGRSQRYQFADIFKLYRFKEIFHQNI